MLTQEELYKDRYDKSNILYSTIISSVRRSDNFNGGIKQVLNLTEDEK
jgi:hypothetical protein